MGVNFRSGCNLLFCVSRSYNGKFAKTVIISLAYYRGGRLSNEILASVFARCLIICFALCFSKKEGKSILDDEKLPPMVILAVVRSKN